MNKLTDLKPTNLKATDKKPNQLKATTSTYVYLENRSISKGQPLPWGLNWAITYPVTLVFQGVRP